MKVKGSLAVWSLVPFLGDISLLQVDGQLRTSESDMQESYLQLMFQLLELGLQDGIVFIHVGDAAQDWCRPAGVLSEISMASFGSFWFLFLVSPPAPLARCRSVTADESHPAAGESRDNWEAFRRRKGGIT